MTDFSKESSSSDVLDYNTAVLKTEEEMKRLLKSAPPVIRQLTNHLSKATGKMIRARALLTCALQQNGTINSDAVKAAAAVELLHLATLVHDDIIDNASKRRGIDTLHKKFGEKYAVLCGDYLFCIALDFAATIKILDHRKNSVDQALPSYMTNICLGEVLQNQNNHNYHLSERAYFKIIKGKTAALFEACFHLGFMFSDEKDTSKDYYTEIGNNIGIIFQLADDCSDYEATQKDTKKPVLSDFVHGVVTLPLIYALRKDKSLRERIAAGIHPRDLKIAVQAAGGLDYAHRKIAVIYKNTHTLIASLEITQEKKALLEMLLQKAAGIAS